MSDRKLIDQLRASVKAYRGSDDRDFARSYESTIALAVKEGRLIADEAALLRGLREALEGWYDAASPAQDSVASLVKTYETTLTQASARLLEAVVARFPRSIAKVAAWDAIVLEGHNKAFLSCLMDGGVLKNSDVVRIAKAHPDRFFESVALDVLLERGAIPPRSVWNSLAGGRDRSPELLAGSEALADAFANDSSGDAVEWLLQMLADRAELSRMVLLQVLREPASVARLTWHLAAVRSRIGGKRGRKAIQLAATVTEQLVPICVEAVESGKRTSESAAWVLRVLLTSAFAPGSERSNNPREWIEKASTRVFGPQLLASLRSAEAVGKGNPTLVCSTSTQVYEVIQQFVASLPDGHGGSFEPPGRATRLQRYLGRKDVVEELLLVMEASKDDVVRKSAIEAALFNVGLRNVGAVGDLETFESHRHCATADSVTPGDSVRITEPGLQLGDADGAVVLRRARVESRASS